MTPRELLATPVAQRRGAVTNETGSYGYILIKQSPDTVLDALLADGNIRATHRDCLADVNGIAPVNGSH